MKIFKFGGASVKNAEAVKNVASILKRYGGEKLLVVISAMDKTTNKLEKVAKAYFFKDGDALAALEEVKIFHTEVAKELFASANHPILDELNNVFVELEWKLEEEPIKGYDFEYDQIVSFGEILSTKIISAYLSKADITNKWVDARDYIKTDNTYRAAKVDWEETERLITRNLKPYYEKADLAITQGFIGVTSENYTTTLGREGSDFTAAIFAYCLDAEEVVIWKDVPGVLNADPKWFDDTVLIPQMNYHDAVELTYFGTSVIHPKTIKPLQNKGIPLKVKSFVNPDQPGTIINKEPYHLPVPSFIFRMDQILVSIMPKDYSFIIEENLRDIFNLFTSHQVKINIMQNSAVSFSVTIDNDPLKISKLIEDLKKDFQVLLNEGLELITIRHFDDSTIDRVLVGKEVLLELKSRSTVQMVVRNV